MYDVIIVGAGVSGLMAATQVTGNVLIIEKNESPGKKLLITGGGRCNLTNRKSNNDFLNEITNKKYLYSAIAKFSPRDIINYFEENGVPLKEEDDGKIFPVSNRSRDILDCLLRNINAEFKWSETVLEIRMGYVRTDKGEYKANNIIIATGGASYKHTGSSGDHLSFAKMLNQPAKALYPAETSIVLKDNLELAGTSVEMVVVKYKNKRTTGNLMFTHKGLSGSSIMKMSEHIYLNDEKIISIDLVPNINIEELIEIFDRDKQLSSFLSSIFSKRFSEYIVGLLGHDKKIKIMTHSEITALIKLLKNMIFDVDRVEDLDKAYVTGGGIDLDYIDTTTMESKVNPGIYFIGEALDVHGPIGGYNITLALATGYLAGVSVNKT